MHEGDDGRATVILSSPKVEGYDSATFIVKEKCVTADSSKQAELSVCTKNRAHHPIYRQIASISLLKAVAMAMD